jgi:hypothetical protein
MQLGNPFVCFTLIVFAIGCGNSTPRTLQSVTADPASADAKDFPSDKNGTAECLPLQVGTVNIQVAVAGDGPLMDVAQLTCP